MAVRFWHRVSPRLMLSGLVVVAALALGGYSLRYASEATRQEEYSLEQSNRVLLEQTIDRIDNFIVDSDRALFDLVDLEHLQKFHERWADIVRLSPAVDAAIVLDDHLQIVQGGFVSKKNAADAEAFRKLFLHKILGDLPLKSLLDDQHRHLHREYDGRDYLMSYIRREQNGRVAYIVLKISLEYMVQKLFPDILGGLEGKVTVGVRDMRDRIIYGQPVSQTGRFMSERAFPTTLYMWRMQMAPPNAFWLSHDDRARRTSELLFVGLMLVITLIGIALLERANRKQQRLNELKSEFIANVSHELKTPLSLIRMFGELLSVGKVKSPEKAREYAEIITRESERLGRLIENVLDFAKMERGRVAYEFHPGSLAAVVERSLDVYRYRAEREGFRLEIKIDADLPDIMIDENAMTLLLLNLLENAVKYGRGLISVYLGRVGKNLRLVVGDEGPGIPPVEQKKIFERFYRTQDARRTNVRGSGIGLSLVKHIAEAHGGTVEVDSNVGRGAAFIVDIPLEQAQTRAA